MKKQEVRKVLFAIPREVHLLDLSGPAHIFYEAKDYGADLELFFVSISEGPKVRSSAGLNFYQLKPFEEFDLSNRDILFIPGLEVPFLKESNYLSTIQPFLTWLKRQYAQGAEICSVCTGSFILAHSGILNGKSATTHWKYLELFARRYSEVHLERNRLFVSVDNIHSSAGVSSGIDLALFILERLYGSKFATDIAKEVVLYFRRSPADPQLSIFLQYRNHLDQRIHDTQDYIIQNLSENPGIEALARIVHMSPRNLSRLFKKTTGTTIGKYIEKLRVEKAVSLFTEGHKTEYVIGEVGLNSPNQLRSLLKKNRGILPSAISSKAK